jgi:hypothetical protein
MTKRVEIYQISFEQYARMIDGLPGRDVLLSAAKLANEIIIGMYDGKVLAYIGLVPPSLLADQSYIWMYTTEVGEAHPLLLARYGRDVIETVLCKYRAVYGHCFSPKSARWLKSLGAEFDSETQFTIRRG